MTAVDAEKLIRFSGLHENKDHCNEVTTPIFVVGNIPSGDTLDEKLDAIQNVAYDSPIKGLEKPPYLFNFLTVDGDYFCAYPGVNSGGDFELFGDDSSYLYDMDKGKTLNAYRKAQQARFEYGETPKRKRGF
jgi:hypothetical protein